MNLGDDNKIEKAEELETNETFLNEYSWEDIKQESKYINDLEEVKTETLGFEEVVEEFISKAQVLYNDFFSRINVENWRGLLISEAVLSIGDRQLLNGIMLEFLMANHYIPQEVWELLEDNFNWNEQKPYLYECYPKGFVDYLFKQINNNNGLRYCYFKEKLGCDYEKFLQYREEALEAFENNKFEYASKCIDNAYEIYEEDPDLLIIKGKYYIHKGYVEMALDIFESILQNYTEDIYARFYRAKILYYNGEMYAALDDCKFIEEHNFNNVEFLLLYAKCYFKVNKLIEAKKLLMDILAEYNTKQTAEYDWFKDEVSDLLEKINLQLVSELTEKLKKSRTNKKMKLELNELYKELGILDSKQVKRKISFKMMKRVMICLLILVVQVIIMHLTMKIIGYRDLTLIKSIEKFIKVQDEDRLIKNSEDIINLPGGVSKVHGELTNAAFMKLYRIPKKQKNNKSPYSYYVTSAAPKKPLFDDMRGYVCFGNIGDKRIMVIVDYDDVEQVCSAQKLYFKGILSKTSQDDSLVDLMKQITTKKHNKNYILDKFIDTEFKVSTFINIPMIVVKIMLLIQALVIVQGLVSSYLLIKNNKKVLSK